MTWHDDQSGSDRGTVALERTEVGTDEEHGRGRGTTYRRRWWTLAILSVSLLIIIIDDTIINVAVPTLQRELGASVSALQWIVDAYIIVFAGLLLTMGALGDRFGRKRFLQLGLLVFAGASVLGSYAGSAAQLAAGRALVLADGTVAAGPAAVLQRPLIALGGTRPDPRQPEPDPGLGRSPAAAGRRDCHRWPAPRHESRSRRRGRCSGRRARSAARSAVGTPHPAAQPGRWQLPGTAKHSRWPVATGVAASASRTGRCSGWERSAQRSP